MPSDVGNSADVRIVRPADLQLCADILTKGALR